MFHEIFYRNIHNSDAALCKTNGCSLPSGTHKKGVREKNYGAVCQILRIFKSKSSLFRIRLFFSDPSSSLIQSLFPDKFVKK